MSKTPEFVFYVCEFPIKMRGFQKYGVFMKAADVLKLEALEEGR